MTNIMGQGPMRVMVTEELLTVSHTLAVSQALSRKYLTSFPQPPAGAGAVRSTVPPTRRWWKLRAQRQTVRELEEQGGSESTKSL